VQFLLDKILKICKILQMIYKSNVIFFIFLALLIASCNKKEVPIEQNLDDEIIKTTKYDELETQYNDDWETQYNNEWQVPYNNGNGTIIETKNKRDIKITVRKHLQRVQLAAFLLEYPDLTQSYKKVIVYKNPDLGKENEIFELKTGDFINISEIHRYDNLKEETFFIWLKISMDEDQSGWINYKTFDPYNDGVWTILETIETSSKKWTVRKLEQWMSVYGDDINVYEKPGLAENNVLFNFSSNQQILSINTIAVTEEKETIGTLTDRWVKIRNEQGRVGWMFGGYAGVERGGPKYLTPEGCIDADFSWYSF
jgi:hypothetical protein